MLKAKDSYLCGRFGNRVYATRLADATLAPPVAELSRLPAAAAAHVAGAARHGPVAVAPMSCGGLLLSAADADGVRDTLWHQCGRRA